MGAFPAVGLGVGLVVGRGVDPEVGLAVPVVAPVSVHVDAVRSAD